MLFLILYLTDYVNGVYKLSYIYFVRYKKLGVMYPCDIMETMVFARLSWLVGYPTHHLSTTNPCFSANWLSVVGQNVNHRLTLCSIDSSNIEVDKHIQPNTQTCRRT